MAEIDLDAVMERSDAALHPDPIEGEHDAIEMETRYWKSAKDVPGLVAELRELRDRMDRHHAYLSGLSGGRPCLICEHEGAVPPPPHRYAHMEQFIADAAARSRREEEGEP